MIKTHFVLRVPASDGRALYINVCGSDVVAESMGAQPTGPAALNASFPYQLGVMRQEQDGHDVVFVLECLFSKATLARAVADKRAHQALIEAAVRIVSEYALPLRISEWSLCTRSELREPDGTYFFAPGRLSDTNLDAVE